jgi:dUTP pyrophosphatase
MDTIQVRVMRLPHAANLAADWFLPLPGYETTSAAGLDLLASLPPDRPITILPGGRAAIPTGFALALPPGVEGQIRPRSGLALHFGVTVLNAPGTIDASYRGEVHVILVNHGNEPFTVERGKRIALLVLAPTMQAAIREVASLDKTTRGIRGFGSTGTGDGSETPPAP